MTPTVYRAGLLTGCRVYMTDDDGRPAEICYVYYGQQELQVPAVQIQEFVADLFRLADMLTQARSDVVTGKATARVQKTRWNEE